jgi:metacaspase-1
MSDKALLLGINEFKKISGLNGCVNDVENMRRLLTEQFGFSSANVKVMLNENVVKSDVKKQMKWLFKDAQPGDRLVFHVSSHGSYTADLDGDEDDGADELVCLYDMDFADPESYLLDDELRRWTESLPSGAELTMVMDCCHSGTGTRLMMAPAPRKPHQQVPMRVDDQATLARTFGGLAPGARGIELAPAAARALDPASQNLVRIRFVDPPPAIKEAVAKRKPKSTRGFVEAKINHVLLAGCRADQTAADATIGGAPNGAFTYHLCETLRGGGVDLDRQQLIDRVEQALRSGHFSQVPQLEASSRSGPLFGGKRVVPAQTSASSAPFIASASPVGGGQAAAGLDQFNEAIRLIAMLTPPAQLEAVRLLQGGFSGGTGPQARATGERHLVYVHGICRHDPGYSNGWWNALQPFTSAFGGGDLGGRRREVLWSDLVNERARALQAERAVDERAAREAKEQQQAKREIEEALEDRVDREIIETAPKTQAGETPRSLTTDRALISIPGLNCLDDFTVYMVSDSVRAAVLQRFTSVVKPLLDSGAELDIVSHSWGTVVAYEGLRELAGGGMTQQRVRNFITVGSALSIGPVKRRLRPENRDGRRPAMVRRWINLNAQGDVVGGPLQNRPYQVDHDFPSVEPFGCGGFLGLVSPTCAHSSYFVAGNTAVNRDIFARFINQA